VLRGTLVRLEDETSLEVRLHTHDEILLETSVEGAEEATLFLRDVMQEPFSWSEGLPLMSEESLAYHYTKHPESIGL
jgi:hypothetical protein